MILRSTHSIEILNHRRDTITIEQVIHNLRLLDSTLTRTNRNKTPSNRDIAFNHGLQGINYRTNVIQRSKVDWDDCIVDVSANRGQLARIRALEKLDALSVYLPGFMGGLNSYRSDFSRPRSISLILLNIIQPNDDIAAFGGVPEIVALWLILDLVSGDSFMR